MRILGPVAILVTAISLLANSPTLAQEDDRLIVPGQRVGRWELAKPIDAYGFGQALSRWEGHTQDGKSDYDGFAVVATAALWVYLCRSDNSPSTGCHSELEGSSDVDTPAIRRLGGLTSCLKKSGAQG